MDTITSVTGLTVTVAAIYTGTTHPLPPDGRPSAIIKEPVSGPVFIDTEGIEGDQQADRRVHGGPDKALHFYPVVHYNRLADRFAHIPGLAQRLVPGVLGENLSEGSHGTLDETLVCLGDRFRFGQALLEVSQPRTPCWKIDARLNTEGIAAYIAETGLSGWYFRVLEKGRAQPGDPLQLTDRLPDAPTLAAFTAVWREHRPAPEQLLAFAGIPGLPDNWCERLQKRAAWLLGKTQEKPPIKIWHPR